MHCAGNPRFYDEEPLDPDEHVNISLLKDVDDAEWDAFNQRADAEGLDGEGESLEDLNARLDNISAARLFNKFGEPGWVDREKVRTADPRIYIKDYDITTRNDYFTRCMSIACGVSSLSLAECFLRIPHPDCYSIEDYLVYLSPRPAYAVQQTANWIHYMSRGATTLEKCIHVNGTTPLVFSVAKVIGVYMRKAIMDNPIKSTHSRVTEKILTRDVRQALYDLFSHFAKERMRQDGFDMGRFSGTYRRLDNKIYL